MESFAFWYRETEADKNSEKKSELSATMNFNLWCECGWNKRKKGKKTPAADSGFPYLDIGFRIRNLNLAEELYFFIPIRIEESSKTDYVEDLGYKYKQTSLVDATFNKSYETTIAAGRKTIEVKCEQNGKIDNFKIYQLDIEHDVAVSKFSDGTIFTIKTSNILDKNGANRNGGQGKDGAASEDIDYYIRFRIKKDPLLFLIHRYSPPNSAIQALFNMTYMIDFRYQNIRSLDNTLIERFSQGRNKIVNVTSLHFLLMTKAYVAVESGDFKNIRKIEPKVWEEYVNGHDTTDLVAYHHVSKPDEKKPDEKYIESSELFVKFKVERSIFLRYLLFTGAVGMIGSLIASGVWEYLKPLIERIL